MEKRLKAGKQDGVGNCVTGGSEIQEDKDRENARVRGEEEIVGDFEIDSFGAMVSLKSK